MGGSPPLIHLIDDRTGSYPEVSVGSVTCLTSDLTQQLLCTAKKEHHYKNANPAPLSKQVRNILLVFAGVDPALSDLVDTAHYHVLHNV